MKRISRTPPASGLVKSPLALILVFSIVSASAATVAAQESDPAARGRIQADGSVFTRATEPAVWPAKADRFGAETPAAVDAAVPLAVEVPPELCFGHGSLESISLTDWEAGLGSWTVGTRSVVNANTFDTEDWAVVGALPDGRPGKAAFVANLDIGNCSSDDETGVLFLQSPTILLPQGAEVPRLAIDHWFATERNWDGGNLKLSRNGGPFTLIEASAIEYNSYESKLFSVADGNTNPLASQPAYTGASDGLDGAWEQIRINLHGLAAAGDSIRLRFDFGIDGCNGVEGWYVDDVRAYSCSAELPPSNCGNGVLNAGEQCDDGNTFLGDGCSNTCQVEAGWECTAPLPPGTILDPGFEAGTPNASWTEASTNFGTPICNEEDCGLGTGSGPASGDYWAWFGGIEIPEESRLSQSVTIPATSSELTFELEASACDSSADFLQVKIGFVPVYLIDGSSPLCGSVGYTTQTVDISAFADGKAHVLEFHAMTSGLNADVSNFFVDDVAIPGAPSECTAIATMLTLKKTVINDNGGNAVPANWTLTASGPTGFSGPGPSVSNNPGFVAGTYHLSETGPSGYSASAWVCTGGTQNDADTITLALGQAATCTITNDDIAPQLTLVKQVVNDDDGSAAPADWRLAAIGPSPLDGPGPTVTSDELFRAGAYQLKEYGGPAGYIASPWVCVGGSQPNGETVSLALGQSATCTITNDDIDPTTVVLKDGFEAK